MPTAVEVLRKIGVVVFWAAALGATARYAWLQLRATVIDGGSPQPDENGRRAFQTEEARSLARQARWWAVLGAVGAIAAIVLTALKR